MEINEIKDVALELMDALASKKLGEVAIELEGVKIKIKAAAPAPSSQLRLPRQLLRQHPLHRRQPQQQRPKRRRRTIFPAGTQVKSPLVGTFYSSPSPDEPPFVLVGQEVREGDTLCIIEAMKVMNEIKAPCSGKVVRIMAQPGDMVEYNQVLCIIE